MIDLEAGEKAPEFGFEMKDLGDGLNLPVAFESKLVNYQKDGVKFLWRNYMYEWSGRENLF